LGTLIRVSIHPILRFKIHLYVYMWMDVCVYGLCTCMNVCRDVRMYMPTFVCVYLWVRECMYIYIWPVYALYVF